MYLGLGDEYGAAGAASFVEALDIRDAQVQEQAQLIWMPGGRRDHLRFVVRWTSSDVDDEPYVPQTQQCGLIHEEYFSAEHVAIERRRSSDVGDNQCNGNDVLETGLDGCGSWHDNLLPIHRICAGRMLEFVEVSANHMRPCNYQDLMPAYEAFAAATVNAPPEERATAFVTQFAARFPDYYSTEVYGDEAKLKARTLRFFAQSPNT